MSHCLDGIFGFQGCETALLDQLQKAPLAPFTVDGQSGFQAVIPFSYDSRGAMFRLFDSISGVWKVLFRNKGEKHARVAIGALAGYPNMPAVDCEEDLRVYGGIPFDEAAEIAPYWREFRRRFFFLPTLEFRFGLESSLSVRVLGDDKAKAHFSLRENLFTLLCRMQAPEARVQLHFEGMIKEPSEKVWQGSVLAAKNAILRDDFSKVVLSRTALMRVPEKVTSGQLMAALEGRDGGQDKQKGQKQQNEQNEQNEKSYLFGFESPTGLSFLGCSPERVLSWQEGFAYVDAIAGTRKRCQDQREDERQSRTLKGSQKDGLEHRSVTDFVAATLEDYCDAYEVLEAQAVLKLKHVQHMITRYKGRLKPSCSPYDLLESLHPTPAVAGMPKKAALDYLREKESPQRGWFSGSVGWVSSFGGDFAIAIRSGLLDRSLLRVFAGAGIVEGSQAEEEWLETLAKMRNFTDLFHSEKPPAYPPTHKSDDRSITL